jgi:hypothetical protein
VAIELKRDKPATLFPEAGRKRETIGKANITQHK